MYTGSVRCLNCERAFDDPLRFDGCPACRTEGFVSNLAPVYDYDAVRAETAPEDLLDGPGGVWSQPELLPVSPEYAVGLGAGATPLVETPALADEVGVGDLYLKDESRNPTWSFKDRLNAVAVAKTREVGADVVTVSSTGNHGASMAAYAAAADLDAVVFTLSSVPETMRTLMQVYGATVVATTSPEGRWDLMGQCVERYGWFPVGNYVSPPVGSNFYGVEGYKTIAYEVVAELGAAPDYVVQPTALADGLHGIWRGFRDLEALGIVDDPPAMIAVEPFGPLKSALENDRDRVEPVETAETAAFSIAASTSTYQGLHALRESDGHGVRIGDVDLSALQQRLARATGVYGEVAAVGALAGVDRLADRGIVGDDDTVVAVNTSSGLKDVRTTASSLPDVPTIPPALDSLRDLLETRGFDAAGS